MTESLRSRPNVTIHYAQTLDGRIATRTGHSQWISGEPSLRLAHQLRAAHEAVMVGVGTVIADNPRLTVRHVAGRSPLRVVVDSTLRTPPGSHVLADDTADTVIATTPRAPRDRLRAAERAGAAVLVVDQDARGRVDLICLLRSLAERGLVSLLIEGGCELITSALRAGVVDRLVVCIAPKLLGSGIPAVRDLEIRRMSQALTFTQSCFAPLGDDLIFDGRLERPPSYPTPALSQVRG